MENYQGTTNYNLLEDSDIVNNLTTTATNKALSANQGKQLKALIDGLLPDLETDTEIPLNFNLWDGKKAYLKIVHTGTLTADSSPTIAHNVSGIANYVQVPGLSYAKSNSSGIVVSLPRPARYGAESGQAVMLYISRNDISFVVGSDSNFDDSWVTILYSKN
jgi:hypothetical protein